MHLVPARATPTQCGIMYSALKPALSSMAHSSPALKHDYISLKALKEESGPLYTKEPFPQSHAGEQYTVSSRRSLSLSGPLIPGFLELDSLAIITNTTHHKSVNVEYIKHESMYYA